MEAAENPLTAPASTPDPIAQRREMIARYTHQLIQVCIANPDTLTQDRKEIRRFWHDRGWKGPRTHPDGSPALDDNGKQIMVDVPPVQVDYDLGKTLAKRSREFANGIVDTLFPIPRPTSAASIPDAPAADGETVAELTPHAEEPEPVAAVA